MILRVVGEAEGSQCDGGSKFLSQFFPLDGQNKQFTSFTSVRLDSARNFPNFPKFSEHRVYEVESAHF